MSYGNRKRLSRWGSRLVSILAIVVVLLGSAGSVSAEPVRAADPTWRAEFYNNTLLFGPPVLVREDAQISFDFGSGSPAPGVNADNFSVRWTRVVFFEEGTYTFTVVTDDGVRLCIDGDLVLDKWFDQAATTYTVKRTMSGGDHHLRLEYYEHTGFARIQLSWAREGVPVGQWHGEFFANMFLTGAPVMARDDPILDFNWGPNSPGGPVPADYFSVRWTSVVNFAVAGNYTFFATHDDGMRVCVDERIIIDKWFPTAERTDTATVYLTAGDHRIRVEYFEQTGLAVARLKWELASAPPPPPPPPPIGNVVIVDDQSPGFIRGGPLSGFRNTVCGYNGHSYWTLNNVTKTTNFGKWVPTLPQAGRYEVYAFVPRCNATTNNACYQIEHAGMRHFVSVNQAKYFDAWVRLGTFTFNGTGNEFVYLSDATGEPYLSRKIGMDAVKFVLVEPTAPPPPTCSVLPKFGFGRVWTDNPTVRARLGCPLQDEVGIVGAEEIFIGGYMFYLSQSPTGPVIYTLFNDGTWQVFPDTWQPPQPESDPSIIPPYGYYQPIRGFGKVWRNNPTVRSKLSWATEMERGVTLSWQPFQHGQMLFSPRLGIFVLFDDGAWKHYN